jgi:adenylyltransferase/sulfurtransferase
MPPYVEVMDLDFTEDDIQRYSRHILLNEVGGIGQARLRAARVLVVGAGGLGSPVMLYLAAGGVGTIGVVDDDVVELSNLQRQVIHGTGSLGQAKVASAAVALRSINPGVEVITHRIRLDGDNAHELISRYDLVCDGTDNFPTRFLVADACVAARRTLISAAVLRFEGQLSVFKPHAGTAYPCYRCLYPEAPPDGMVPSCAEAGVLGAVTGVMGTLQATEAMKEILGIGESLAGRLLIWDALAAAFRTVRFQRSAACPVCRPPHADWMTSDVL